VFAPSSYIANSISLSIVSRIILFDNTTYFNSVYIVAKRKYY
jgi:hypothetical protein